MAPLVLSVHTGPIFPSHVTVECIKSVLSVCVSVSALAADLFDIS